MKGVHLKKSQEPYLSLIKKGRWKICVITADVVCRIIIWVIQEISPDKTFEEAAKAAGQSVEEAKRNILQQLKKELEKKKK